MRALIHFNTCKFMCMLTVVDWCYLNRGKTKCTSRHVRPAKTRISLHINTVLAPEETLNPWLPLGRPSKTLVRLRKCAVWSEHSIRAHANVYLLLVTRTFFLSQTDFPKAKNIWKCWTSRESVYFLCALQRRRSAWGKEIKCEACRASYLFFATSLIKSIIQEHDC